MRTVKHRVDFCVVGGGLSGMCAAVAAARRGARVLLVHDRPVPGGNASSEIRMWICGAHNENRLETGLLEEIQLDNLRFNPTPTYALWDMVLYNFLRAQPGLEVLYNTAVNAARMDGGRLVEVSGYQSTAETTHQIEAALFADCSGDSVLAPLTGAEFRVGREASGEFGEDIAPAAADRRTMGMSCLLQTREHSTPQPYTPPSWAKRYESPDELPHRFHGVEALNNFWWIELGGEFDSIHDTEQLRERLLSITFGVWDLYKNRAPGREKIANLALDWVGFLPGKRESRRYVGDHILTQNDVRAEGRFDDIIAYGGWTMDDHHPAGIDTPEKPTIYHAAPSPYGIPYRCCYSKNVPNLFMAGRNISTTHSALSSTRVMATCALLGQAVGTAAALALREKTTPRGVYEKHLAELQSGLMDDDAWLPGHARPVPELSRAARLTIQSAGPAAEAEAAGDAAAAEVLRNGHDRPIGEAVNAWEAVAGRAAVYEFAAPTALKEARMVFDSDLNRDIKNMPCHFFKNTPGRLPPPGLVRAFVLEALDRPGGSWREVARVTDNHQRLVRVPLTDAGAAAGLRLIPLSTWAGELGSPKAPSARVFAFDVR